MVDFNQGVKRHFLPKQRKKKSLAELGFPFKASRIVWKGRGGSRIGRSKVRSFQSSVNSENIRACNSRFLEEEKRNDPIVEANATLDVAKALGLHVGEEEAIAKVIASSKIADREIFLKSKVRVC